jgi:hypothetical protein
MRGADLILRAHGTAAKLSFKNAEWITAIEGDQRLVRDLLVRVRRELVRRDLNVMSD